MKKLYVVILVVILALAGAAYFVSNKEDGAPADGISSVPAAQSVNACEVFTLAEATELLGEETTAGNAAEPVVSDDVGNSSCSYSNNATDTNNVRIITVMVRTGLTELGKESNTNLFNEGLAGGLQKVDGFGEGAYYDPTSEQLSILKEGNLISVRNGGAEPGKGTLEAAKMAAAKAVN